MERQKREDVKRKKVCCDAMERYVLRLQTLVLRISICVHLHFICGKMHLIHEFAMDVAYRLIRADPPPAVCRSSSSVIWLVSPIVLMSSAPWVTPKSTHSCGDFPVRKP
jgi:hypothetical protein